MAATVYSIMGPGGGPMKQPYGSFSGKPPQVAVYSVMGPAGAPMKQPYGSFAGKTPGVGSTQNKVFLAEVGRLMGR